MRKLIVISMISFLILTAISYHWYSHKPIVSTKNNICTLAQPVIVMSEDKNLNRHS